MFKRISLTLVLLFLFVGVSHGVVKSVTDSLSSSTGGTPIYLIGEFTISLSGTWAGVMTLQRWSTKSEAWRDISPTFTADVETGGTQAEFTRYRWFFTTYTSGTVVCEISWSGKAP